MSDEELLFEFRRGPYQVLHYIAKAKNDKPVIEINEGDLGRLPIEDLETVEELRECLDRIEGYLKEQQRKKEEL